MSGGKKVELWAEVKFKDVMGHELEGSIPLLLPPGKYPHHQNLPSDLTTVGKVALKDWLKESSLIRRGEPVEKRVEFVRDINYLSLYFNPRVPIDSDAMEIFSKVNILAFLADDVLEGRDFFGRTLGSGLTIGNVPGDIFSGKIDTISKVNGKVVYPALARIARAQFGIAERARSVLKGFREHCGAFARTTSDSYRGVLFLEMEEHYEDEAVGQLEDLTFQYLRGIESGGEPFLELSFLVNYVWPTEDMRNNLLFRRLVDLATRQTAFVNDLLGCQRDLESKKGYSTVVYKYRKYHDLPRAFKEVVELITRELDEVASITRRIRTLYPGDSAWESVLQVVEEYIDGHVYWYSEAKRYGVGNSTIKIVEKEPRAQKSKFQLHPTEHLSDMEDEDKEIWED